jgi:hypothetical protein
MCSIAERLKTDQLHIFSMEVQEMVIVNQKFSNTECGAGMDLS